jgi:hypothetical protein
MLLCLIYLHYVKMPEVLDIIMVMCSLIPLHHKSDTENNTNIFVVQMCIYKMLR